jgi:hypothetical protein
MGLRLGIRHTVQKIDPLKRKLQKWADSKFEFVYLEISHSRSCVAVSFSVVTKFRNSKFRQIARTCVPSRRFAKIRAVLSLVQKSKFTEKICLMIKFVGGLVCCV